MALEYLENLGRARSLFEASADSPFKVIMKDFAEMQIKLSKDALISGSPSRDATGTLAQSIGFKLNFDDEVKSIDFLMEHYWDYINSGVDGYNEKGKAVMNQFGEAYTFRSLNPSEGMIDAFSGGGGSLEGWMRAKGINTLQYTNADGEFIVEDLVTDQDFRSAAFVLARGVKSHGIQANNFINNTFSEEALLRFEESILNAIEKILN